MTDEISTVMDDIKATLTQKEQQLRQAADKIRAMIVGLGEASATGPTIEVFQKAGGKGQRSAAARKKASQRMRAYWATKRKLRKVETEPDRRGWVGPPRGRRFTRARHCERLVDPLGLDSLGLRILYDYRQLRPVSLYRGTRVVVELFPICLEGRCSSLW